MRSGSSALLHVYWMSWTLKALQDTFVYLIFTTPSCRFLSPLPTSQMREPRPTDVNVRLKAKGLPRASGISHQIPFYTKMSCCERVRELLFACSWWYVFSTLESPGFHDREICGRTAENRWEWVELLRCEGPRGRSSALLPDRAHPWEVSDCLVASSQSRRLLNIHLEAISAPFLYVPALWLPPSPRALEVSPAGSWDTASWEREHLMASP